MVEYTIFFTKKANKDKILLKNANLDKNAIELLNILQNNYKSDFDNLILDYKEKYNFSIIFC